MNAPPQKDNTLKIVLLVVGGILAVVLLAFVVIFAASFLIFQKTMGEGEVMTAEIRAQSVMQAAEIFKIQHGRYPASPSELTEPPKGKPVMSEVPLDPWARELRFVVEGSRLRVESAGPDGDWGTADDVVTTTEP